MHKEKGLTLLESIIATAIVAIGFLAVFQMVNYSVHSIGVSGERTKANYLVAMVAEDLIGDKNTIISGNTKLKDQLLIDRDGTKQAWKMEKCSTGATATGPSNAYFNKVKKKWNNWLSKKRLKCKSDKDVKSLKLFDTCSKLVAVDPKPSCGLKNNRKYLLESTGDGVSIIGKMEVRLNNGKVKKALWFQVE
jgi:prepilin-type N-terminal cleavage/methylation domain-containing protein